MMATTPIKSAADVAALIILLTPVAAAVVGMVLAAVSDSAGIRYGRRLVRRQKDIRRR